MMQLVLERVGLATLQDLGREHLNHLGVPTAGVWDRHAYARLGALVDIPPGATPVIESWSGDLAWRSSADLAFVTWGPAVVEIDGTSVAVGGMVTHARAGATVLVRRTGPGPVLLLVPGLTVSPVLGSMSYDSFARIGPPPLTPGQVLDLVEDAQLPARSRVGAFLRVGQEQSGPLTFVAHRAGHADRHLMAQAWIVDDVSRSGVRLRSPLALSWRATSWASGPVRPGVIQVPPDGLPIVLGPDAGTSGGYPIAGVLTDAALCAIAYASPGDGVTFVPVEPPVIDAPAVRAVVW